MELSHSSKHSKKIPKLTMQQIHDNQQTLKRINRKIDFHKNPRYQNINQHKYAQSIQSNNMTLAKQSKGAFRCQPSEIVFSNFQKDIIYQFEVTLVNTSKLLRRIKVPPIASQEFVVSEIRYPNQNSGDIASGMKVKIVIRFFPKQIKTYESELVVLSEDNVLKIPIFTLRDEPQLIFNKQIVCGSCWIGNKLEVTERFLNRGGNAQFKFVSKDKQVINNKLKFDTFELSPCQFRLKKNQYIQVKIQYFSPVQGSSKQRIQITSEYISNNNLYFTIEGSSFTPKIELINLNGSKCNSALKQQKIYFQNVLPNIQSSYTLAIKNLANLNLNYYWEINNNESFSISQEQGAFKPLQIKQFTLLYNSSSFIPNFANSKIFIGSDKTLKSPQYQIMMSASPQKYETLISPSFYEFPNKLVYGTWYEKQVVLTGVPEETPVDITLLKSSPNTQNQFQLKRSFNGKMTIKFRIMIIAHAKEIQRSIYKIEVENSNIHYFSIHAKSQLPSIKISEAVDFQLMKINTEAHSVIILENTNHIPLNIRIINKYKYYLPEHQYLYDYEQEDYLNIEKRFWIEKEQFKIQPQSKMEIACSYMTKSNAQSISTQIEVLVQNGVSCSFQLNVEVQQVHVMLSCSYYNLRQLFVNNTYSLKQLIRKQSKLQLLNLGNIDTDFRWQNIEHTDCRFQFIPSQGTIKAKTKQEIEVKIVPLRNSKLNHKITCVTSANDNLTVCFEAEIRGLEIRYSLVNEQLAKRITVKQSFDLSKTDRSKTNRLASLASSVSYLKEKDKQRIIYPQLTNVGFFNCQINIPKQIQIMLENHSDLDTKFSIRALKYFVVAKKQQLNQTSQFPGKTAAFSSEMGATFIAKRQLQKSQKEYLKESANGVSIICEPSEGELRRGSETKIKITLFNNICGRFTDSLEVNILNYDTKVFPIDIDIKGTPIGVSRNQLGINFNSIFPIYKFGCFPTNSGTVRKQFKVINKGPRPVELVWKIYSLNKPIIKDPFKITLGPPSLGSTNPVSINWQAIEPECQQNSLFSIQPHSKLIQSQQQTSFTISYLTLQQPQSSKCIFVGEPYLINEEGEKMKMELMPIIPEAETVKPHLRMDKYVSNLADDNLVVLQKYAGEESGKDTKSIILENPTNSNLICSFESMSSEFKIVDTYTNSGSNNLLSKTQSQFTKSLTKSLGGNKPVQSCFNIAPGSYVELKLKFDSDIKNTDDWPVVSKFRKQGKILISYSNEDTQEISLLGELYRPILRLNTSGNQGAQAQQIIDFGVVHIKNDKRKTIYLTNISPVQGKWTLKYVKLPPKRKFQQVLWTKLDQEDISITDDKDCFNFSVNEGVVESMTIPIKTMPNTLALPAPDDNYAKTHTAQKIMIAFKPKKDVLYKSRFKILVQNGEPMEFMLRGMGTYQEQYLK